MTERVVINEELCIGCGACVEICPQKILSLDETSNIVTVADHSRCDRLRGCERVCPSGAIKVN
ncbi:ferredoxin family protein [Chloroflexota bacterium]